VAFEPNLVPGLANRIVGLMVSAAAVQFEQTCRHFRGCHVTGVPVRKAFFDATQASASSAASQADGKTLLVFGGSQGAHAINQAVIGAMPALSEMKLHVIHQTGERDYNEAQAAYLRAGVRVEVHPFIEDMPGAFARADLLLCRSGASTVAEVTAAGKPAIFVPFPHAADDHQTRNAEALVQSGAALLIRESELTAQRLIDTVCGLLDDPTRLVKMAAAGRRMAHPHAARDIALLAARVAGFGEQVAAAQE
jgi:UDP-N-acetylglucosamine--N-acetylmuramyl-(pentapeptide) pyrophosphoryl-undecaprenol N-acetylglucosamine transferase